jgi:hypothetical protein
MVTDLRFLDTKQKNEFHDHLHLDRRVSRKLCYADRGARLRTSVAEYFHYRIRKSVDPERLKSCSTRLWAFRRRVHPPRQTLPNDESAKSRDDC